MSDNVPKISQSEANNMLKDAAFEGSFDRVVIAIEVYGANINALNGAPIRFAVKKGNHNATRVALYLIDKGAELHFKGYEAALNCMLKGNVTLLNAMISACPDILKQTALLQKIARSRTDSVNEIISLCVEKGVEPNLFLDFTPTYSMHIQGKVMSHLLSLGADLSLNNGAHATFYFEYLRKPPYELFDMFDKKVHPYIVQYMGKSIA